VYYGNLTTAFSTQVEFSFPNPVFNGFVGLAVSRLDNPTAASVADKNSWKPPVILSSRQGQTSFFDKEQIWADNAQSSPFFGRVYLCANDFRSNAAHKQGNSPTPMLVFTSRDGGSKWTKVQVTSAATGTTNNPNQFGYSGCTIRTGSNGVVYLFAERFAAPTSSGLTLGGQHVMFKSFDGGAHWTKGKVVQTVTNPCYFVDPVEGRCVMDGYGGARTDLAASPSVSIANGAPTGANATNEIIDAWTNAPSLNNETTNVSFSKDGGSTWTPRQAISLSGDRPIYSAPAIAPDGSKAYVIYEADTAPFAADFSSPRPYHGVFLSAALTNGMPTSGWTPEFNEPATGDLRATYPGHDMYQERVGDYIYAAASNDYGVGLWISAVNAAVCPAIQSWRASSFAAGAEQFPAPWPLTDCPANWGNTDAYSVSTG